MAVVTESDLFEAVRTGDVGTLEAFFAQPAVLSKALDVENEITPELLVQRVCYPRHAPHVGAHDWWVYHSESYENIYHAAVTKRQYDVVAWLVSSPIAVALHRSVQYSIEIALRTAIYDDDLSMLELLLASKAWATFPDEAKMFTLSSLLAMSIIHWRGVGAAFELLVGHGADLSRCVPGGPSSRPLICAVNDEPTGSVIMAMARAGEVAVGEAGALCYAANTRNHRALVSLLAVGADPSGRDPYRYETPLHLAAERGYDDIVTMLLVDSCVDIDAQDEAGRTPLTGAVRRNMHSGCTDVDHVATATVLLEHGASTAICTTKNYDCAPLHWAVRSRDMAMTRTLLTHGADPNLPSAIAQETPTHIATNMVRRGQNLETALRLLELLVEHGADLSRENPDGVTPCDMLRESEHGLAWLRSRAIVQG